MTLDFSILAYKKWHREQHYKLWWAVDRVIAVITHGEQMVGTWGSHSTVTDRSWARGVPQIRHLSGAGNTAFQLT